MRLNYLSQTMHNISRVLVSAMLVLFFQYTIAQSDSTGFTGFKVVKSSETVGVLKVNPIPLLEGQIPVCGELRIEYEQMLAKRQSLTIGVSYNYPNFFLLAFGGNMHNHYGSFYSNYSMRGARVMLGYRYYPLDEDEAPEGFYFGPFISYNFVDFKDKHSKDYEIINYFDACGIVGYQVMADKFSFDVFGGLGYRNNFVVNEQYPFNRYYDRSVVSPFKWFEHVKIALQFNFGYVF
ncbi:MAG TPA: hypothetical protein VG603_16795 [Chitinophagales bacterium]|nr:hypothetical protein [Chitinophagales bacterium]